MGEPAGIGTEITLKAYESLLPGMKPDDPGFFLIDDPARVGRVKRALNADIAIATISDPAEAADAFPRGLPILPVSDTKISAEVQFGQPDASTGSLVTESIAKATSYALQGKAGGIVTNPIQKQTLLENGFKFPGHTEYLGELTAEASLPDGVKRGPVMLLAGTDLRVAPVTIHVPLKQVPEILTTELVTRVCVIVAQSMTRDFGVPAPVLALCGLNPHAGEGGQIGREDVDIIAPAVETLRTGGINAVGPIPADTMFHAEARSKYHVAIAMYHDQGLVPIKTIDFYGAVNVTLGLPIIRTSPDHGTGLNIAGQGVARPDSQIQAIIIAKAMAARRAEFDRQHASKLS